MDSTKQFDDETLMAFADGEADAATAQSIEQAMRHDRRVAERVALFRRTALLAKQAFEADLQQPVPAALRASVQAAIDKAQTEQRAANALPRVESVGAVGSVPQATRPAANQARYALVASLAALAFGVLGYLAGSRPGGEPSMLAGGFTLTQSAGERGAFVEALSKLPSGQKRELSAGASLELLASVRDRAGSLCREFKLQRGTDATLGVACRSQQQWAVTFAAMSPPGETGYAPASSTPALDAYLSAIEAGAPLSAEEEGAALAGQ